MLSILVKPSTLRINKAKNKIDISKEKKTWGQKDELKYRLIFFSFVKFCDTRGPSAFVVPAWNMLTQAAISIQRTYKPYWDLSIYLRMYGVKKIATTFIRINKKVAEDIDFDNLLDNFKLF